MISPAGCGRSIVVKRRWKRLHPKKGGFVGTLLRGSGQGVNGASHTGTTTKNPMSGGLSLGPPVPIFGAGIFWRPYAGFPPDAHRRPRYPNPLRPNVLCRDTTPALPYPQKTFTVLVSSQVVLHGFGRRRIS